MVEYCLFCHTGLRLYLRVEDVANQRLVNMLRLYKKEFEIPALYFVSVGQPKVGKNDKLCWLMEIPAIWFLSMDIEIAGILYVLDNGAKAHI
jgi:hypothetical protein